MKHLLFCSFCLFFLQINLATAQEIQAKVLDYDTRQPIPYASVVYGPNRGVITNDEGTFHLISGNNAIDSLSISSMGYETVKLKSTEITGNILLKPQTNELSEVFLTNKDLSAKEIIKRIKTGVETNYNFDLTQKRFFFRESNFNTIPQFELEVDKSTIDGIDQNLMNQIAFNVPKENDSYKEVLGDFYGNYDTQKINVLKAANLHNPKSTSSLTELTDELEELFMGNLKRNSYLKIRSGIIGFKVDARELEKELHDSEKEIKPIEKTPEEKEEALAKSQQSLHKRTDREIKKLWNNMFWKNDIAFNVFEKPNKYRFTIDGYTILDKETVYVLTFEPKRGADYKGKIYVNAADFGVHRLDYENVKPLKKFRLFGISALDDVHRGKMIFAKDENGKYNPTYIEQEQGESFGFDRPLTFIEKNKMVPGRRKQNELDLDIRIKISQVEKYQLVVYENHQLDQTGYDGLEISDKFEYQTFKRYNPEFWNGNNIIEPNAAIKRFTVLEK